MRGMFTDETAGRSSVNAHPTLWIRLGPAALRRLMRRIYRATHRPAYPPADCDCLPPLLLCCEHSDQVLNGRLTLPTSSSYSLASYKSNTHLELLSDMSSRLLHGQLEPVDGQRAAALKCVWRSGASGVPHAEDGTHA